MNLWLMALGLVAQALFFMRFFVQWVASERRRESVMPVTFWYFSVAGALLLLVYSILRQDPVFILGQVGGLIVYSRNLYFIHRQKRTIPHAP